MELSCGIDPHSTNSVIAIIDQEVRQVYEKRLPNDLSTLLEALSPYRGSLAGCAVESTYNGYELVDGLMAKGYDVRLVNTVTLRQYDGLKHSDDYTDARHRAHVLRLGILPEGYIYPNPA